MDLGSDSTIPSANARNGRMSRLASQQHDAELVDAPPQIPEGEYQVVYIGHETKYIFTTPKVFVHYRIVDGSYDGLELYAAYSVKALKGKPRKSGAFKLSHSSKLYREMVALSGATERPDRVSLRGLKRAVLRAKVRTVTRDSKQNPLPLPCRYSIVDSMLSVEAGTVL